VRNITRQLGGLFVPHERACDFHPPLPRHLAPVYDKVMRAAFQHCDPAAVVMAEARRIDAEMRVSAATATRAVALLRDALTVMDELALRGVVGPLATRYREVATRARAILREVTP
jgi:hypothetical protein